jgi:carotenoid cleavage dioxygenase
MEAMTNGGPMVKFNPEAGTRLGVMPRFGTAEDMRWHTIENGHAQHFWNAWHENGVIELSGTFNTNPQYGMDTSDDLSASSATADAGIPTRFRIDLGTGVATVERFDDMGGDFCRINDARNGRRTRYHYMCGFRGEASVIGQFDSVVKYDDRTNARTTWYAGARHHIGEALFAPDPQGTAEDDGWLVFTDHDHAANTTDVCIVDARNVEAGPIARVHMPRKLPFGFHVNWFPAEA